MKPWVRNRCPVGTVVQSLLLARPQYDVARARLWARKHGFRAGRVDVTDRYVRLRQIDPGRMRKGSLRTITLRAGRVKAIVGCPR